MKMSRSRLRLFEPTHFRRSRHLCRLEQSPDQWRLIVPLSLRFSTIEPVSATAAPFSPPQSHTECRCSRKFLYRAAPGKDAFALAWRVCRSSRRAGSPPSFQNPFFRPVASSESGDLNLIVRLAPLLFCRSFGPAAMQKRPDEILPAHNDGD